MRITTAWFGNAMFGVACLLMAVLAGVRLYDRFYPASEQRELTAQEDPFQRGTKLAWLDKGAIHASGNTALLLINSQCTFCDQSLPFYKRLAAAGQRKTAIVAVSIEPEATLKKYLDENGLRPDKALHFDRMNTQGTPTLVVVDTQGTVLRSWLGRLSPKQEAEAEKFILGS